MIGNTIDNVERFLDVNIMVGFYQGIENRTTAGISHLAFTQPNRVMFTHSSTPDVRCSTGTCKRICELGLQLEHKNSVDKMCHIRKSDILFSSPNLIHLNKHQIDRGVKKELLKLKILWVGFHRKTSTTYKYYSKNYVLSSFSKRRAKI